MLNKPINLREMFIVLTIPGILLMTSCKRSEPFLKKNDDKEKVMEISNQQDKVVTSGVTQKPQDLTDQIVEIKKDGNFINHNLCSMEEIAKKGQEWSRSRGKWTLLLADDSIPFKRIDEIREILANAGVYFITQSKVGTDEIVYPAGDVSKFAKFSQGDFEVWFNKLINSPEVISKIGHQHISFGFIIDKNGKVKDAHIIKGTDSPEKDAAFEKILNQIPDWEPAMKNNEKVSVFYWMH